MRSRLLAAAASLCVAVLTVGIGGAGPVPVCDQTPITFRTPIRLGTGLGYEPGIDIDSVGTIYVTAHKNSLVREEGTRLASYLWRSTDGGLTFQDMSGLGGATKQLFAFEGDLAIDAMDRLYFVDTWAGDNHVYRYSDHGATMDFYRPAIPDPEADDRPWLAAHHDGIVYYMSNSVIPTARLIIHRSTDGGQTFDPVGFPLAGSLWGFIDADPNSDYVYAVANDRSGAGAKMFVWVSPDRGVTWSKVQAGAYEFGYDLSGGHEDAFPAIAVSPDDGSVYAIFGDDGKKVKLLRSVDHGATWTEHDVTPFEGTYSYSWVTVGENGDVGIIFQATSEQFPSVHVYGMIWRPDAGCLLDGDDPGSLCTGPAETYARLTSSTVADQPDFFQAKFSSDGALNVPYRGKGNDIRFTRQTSGPNLSGGSFCGIVGAP